MAFSTNIKNKAFEYFCNNWSMERIRDRLRDEFPSTRKLSVNTINRWKLKENWEKRRDAVKLEVCKKQDETIADSQAELARKASDALTNFYEELEIIKPETFYELMSGMRTQFMIHRKMTGLDNKGGEINSNNLRVFLERTRKVMLEIPAFAELVNTPNIWSVFMAKMEAEFAET